MDPVQALTVLEQVCPLAHIPLAQHRLAQQALVTLRSALLGEASISELPRQEQADDVS